MKYKLQKKFNQLLVDWLPPAIYRIIQNTNGITWTGNYNTWDEAQNASVGYFSPIILEKVKDALLKVKNGEAIYERDSVIFDEIEYSWPLLSALMWVAAQSKGTLNIIDYGGSLGSTYYQNKAFLSDLYSISWNIVEQKHFVEVGKQYFENDELEFYANIKNCLGEKKSDVILFASVIQYLEKPYHILKKIMSWGFKYIIFDRTTFIVDNRDKLTIQKVPKKIYPASYPCWFFNIHKFYSFFYKDYELIADFNAHSGKLRIDNTMSGFEKGMIFKRKKIS